jgi:hypothetical protein
MSKFNSACVVKKLSAARAPKYRDIKCYGMMQLRRLEWMWNVGEACREEEVIKHTTEQIERKY